MNRTTEMTYALPYTFPYEAPAGVEAANDDVVVAAVPQPSGYRDGERRERDMGVGYGNSSGYARNRRYAAKIDHDRFRFG